MVAPEQADVFVVPIFHEAVRGPSALEMGMVHDFMPPDQQESIQSACSKIADTDWSRALHPHLTARTAYRHIFLHIKYFSVFGFCNGASRTFEARVVANPSLRNWAWPDNSVDPSSPPNGRSFSFAYPSVVHLSRADTTPCKPGEPCRSSPAPLGTTRDVLPMAGAERATPWAYGVFERPYLMMFGGSMHGSEVARRLRPFLRAACVNYSEPDCKLVTAEQMPTVLAPAMEAKMHARFCLEPPGYGDERKSIADALTLGCIPVTFVGRVERPGFWPHHWDEEWRTSSHIFLPYEEVLAGRLDVREALRAIPSSKVEAMQRTIARYAHRIHYAFEEGAAAEPDAVALLWRALADAATQDLTQHST